MRLVAHVPAEDLAVWVPAGVKPVAAGDTAWLDGVPLAAQAAAITEWYVEPRRVVGIDRERAVVAYRVWAD